jgi:drug/metabolite transporter (DMT)-like permease
MSSTPSTARLSRGYGLTVLASVLWGSSFIGVEVGLGSAAPLVLASLRFSVASAGVLALVPFFGGWNAFGALLRDPRVWALGGIEAAGFALQFAGQGYAGIADATLLSNLFPAFVPLLAFGWLHERLTSSHWAAIGLSAIGLVAVTYPHLRLGGTAGLGDVLLLVSAGVYGLFIVLSKRWGLNSPASAGVLILVMGAWFSPALLYTMALQPVRLMLPAVAWAAIVYLAIVGTIAALTLYLAGLRWVSASRSSMLLLFEPVTGLGLTALWYQGSITPAIGIGAVLILAAIGMACWPVRPSGARSLRAGTNPRPVPASFAPDGLPSPSALTGYPDPPGSPVHPRDKGEGPLGPSPEPSRLASVLPDTLLGHPVGPKD